MTDPTYADLGVAIHPAANVFPLLPPGELHELSVDISRRGLINPIVMLPDGRLLDGRNRLLACRDAGVEPTYTTFTGDDPVAFVVSVNLRHRHLDTGQRAMLATKILPMLEDEARQRQGARNDLCADLHTRKSEQIEEVSEPEPKPQPEQPAAPKMKTKPKPRKKKRAADQAASLTGSSSRAVGQAKRIAASDPALAAKVERGEISLDRAERILRDRAAEAKRVEQAKLDAQALDIPLTVDIRHGDFREVLADIRNVDAIITDPPYPKEFLPLLADLAEWSDKVLAEDGVLAVLFGQTYLPDVYRLLDSGQAVQMDLRLPHTRTGLRISP